MGWAVWPVLSVPVTVTVVQAPPSTLYWKVPALNW